MVMTLKVEARPEQTRSEIKQLRGQGKIPGVVYGNKVGNAVISVDEKELLALLRKNPHAVIELELPEGGKQPVMMNEIQRGKLNRELLHVDFHQINMDQPVKTVVGMEFTGEAIGAREGGIVQIQMHELEIRCLPQHIPTSIPVDISGLSLGDNLLVKDLTIPADIEVKSEPHDLIVTVLAPQKEVEEQPTAAADGEAQLEKVEEGQTV